jgi:hypothetical protein
MGQTPNQEIQEAARHLLTVLRPQQAGFGKFTIQNKGPVQAQIIGDHNTITQQFGKPSRAQGQNKSPS